MLFLLSPLSVVGTVIPLYTRAEGPTVMSVLATCVTGGSEGFGHVWLTLSADAVVGASTSISHMYMSADTEFLVRTVNSTLRVVYPRCLQLPQITNNLAALNPFIQSTQMGIGPGSALMNLTGSISIVDSRLILGQSEQDFIQQFCLPDSIITIPYYRDSNVRSGISLTIEPQVSIVLIFPQGVTTTSRVPSPSITRVALLTSEQEIGFDIESGMYNQIVDVIYAESMYVHDQDIFLVFANCERIRAVLPDIQFTFTDVGNIVIAPEDYTEIGDGDLCSLQLRSVPLGWSIMMNPFRLAGLHWRLTTNAFSFCDAPNM